MNQQSLIALVAVFFPLAAQGAAQTAYASGINLNAGAGISGFDPSTGLSTENIAFAGVEVNAQVTADGTKSVYVAEPTAGAYAVVVYSMRSGTLLGSIPIAAYGNLALSPNSVLAYVNAIEGGLSHVIEVNLDSLLVVLDAAYSPSASNSLWPIAVSPNGKTVFTELGLTLYALDAVTLQATNSNDGGGMLGLQVTPDGSYLFGLVEVNGPEEGIQFVSTSNLSVTSVIDLPRAFMPNFTTGIAISGDGSTIAVLGFITTYKGMTGPPIALLNLSTRTFTFTMLPDVGYNAIALNQTGSEVYLGDGTGLISAFDPQTSAVTPAFDAAQAVASLQSGPNGKLYAGYYFNIASVVEVDLSTNQLARTFLLPSGILPSFTILENAAGTRLYSSGRPTMAAIPQFSAQHFGPVPPTTVTYSSLAWNADQSGIWAAGTHTLDLLDPHTLAVQQSILLVSSDAVPLGINDLVITPDQSTAIITYGRNPNEQDGAAIALVNLTSGIRTATIPLDAPGNIVLSPNGRYAYITGVLLGPGYPQPYYPIIVVLDLTTDQLVGKFLIPVSMNHVALSLAISADGTALYTTAAGKVFALSSADGKVIWSVEPGVETVQVSTIPGSTDLITSDRSSNYLTRLNSAGQTIDTIDVGTTTAYLTVLAH